MQLSKAEDLRQQLFCLLELRLRQGNPMDAADGVLRGNWTVFPAAALVGLMMGHEFEGEPVRISERQHLFIKACQRRLEDDPVLRQASDPVGEGICRQGEGDSNDLSRAPAPPGRV